MNNIDYIVKKLKKDTHNAEDITYRIKYIHNKKTYIIYNESLTASDKISDFIIRSLDKINNDKINKTIINTIQNNIDNFKTNKINTYKQLCYYLNNGFTIILIKKEKTAIALETRRNLTRSISTPQTENTIRASMDAFVEDIQTNIGLIRKRIKSNDLLIKSYKIGKYTKTTVNIIAITTICNKKNINIIENKLKKINIDKIINIGTIKNLIETENFSILPTTMTTERPDKVCNSLLNGKIIILIDNSPFALILPVFLNDFFISEEDNYSKSINISLTRTIRYLAFIITIITPALYIATTTYNQEILPTKLLINFAIQRESVPFKAFIEAIIMLLSFEILKECDLRLPNFTTSSLSIVGALILGEAAVAAGIVSPIMIIVIAITETSALLITEPELINGIRWYRLLFIIMSNILGLYGILLAFIIFTINLTNKKSLTIPYTYPISPININGLKNSIIKLPLNKLNYRQKILSNNIIKYKEKK